MKAVVSEKGQVTIPKRLRDRLGIRAGQVLEFREDRGSLVASKGGDDDPVARVTGVLVGFKGSVDGFLDATRGKRPKR